jgi:hypothetical protein
MGLDTKTYWLTDRHSQCGFGFDFDFDFETRVGSTDSGSVKISDGDESSESSAYI